MTSDGVNEHEEPARGGHAERHERGDREGERSGPDAPRGPFSTKSELWARVNDRLDRRRDPLDDPRIVSTLVSRPEWMDAVVEARALARRLAGTVDDRGTGRPYTGLAPWLGLAAAAAILVAALLVPIGPPRDSFPGTDPGAVDRFPAVASRPEPEAIESYRMTFTVERADRRVRTLTIDDRGTRRLDHETDFAQGWVRFATLASHSTTGRENEDRRER